MYAFEYVKPGSAADAVGAADEETRYLAGGQSLVQSMRLRLASASKLIDLGAIPDLAGITVEQGAVRIGAMTTHAAVAASAEVRQAIPALAELAGGIGDPMVRNMGTIGGSLANADPAACYPAGVLGLGATIQTDRREIAADDFFLGLYETALEPGELIRSVSFPVPERAAYMKFKQPASRFALVGVMVAKGPAGVRAAVTGVRLFINRQEMLFGIVHTPGDDGGLALGLDQAHERNITGVVQASERFSDWRHGSPHLLNTGLLRG